MAEMGSKEGSGSSGSEKEPFELAQEGREAKLEERLTTSGHLDLANLACSCSPSTTKELRPSRPCCLAAGPVASPGCGVQTFSVLMCRSGEQAVQVLGWAVGRTFAMFLQCEASHGLTSTRLGIWLK